MISDFDALKDTFIMKRNHIIDSIIDSGLITQGAYIVAGVSGGPDSLCMLHALSQLADSYDLNIVPVHVNHKLRAEADAEEDNVVRITDRMGLDCITFEADCKGLLLTASPDRHGNPWCGQTDCNTATRGHRPRNLR